MRFLARRTARRLALVNGVARCGLGMVALTLPALPLRPWIGTGAADRDTRLLARALGGRDLALGAGTVAALVGPGPVRPWTRASGLADLGDVVVTATSWSRLPAVGRLAVAAAAAAGALAALLVDPAVDDPT